MLDYFGSVMKSDQEIDTELISRFRDYNESYIESIINELRLKRILTSGHSVCGWMVFVGKYTVNKIKSIIAEQTRLNKQKLEFMKYVKEHNIDNDVAFMICEKIDSKLIIINDEL
tara:strand:+ start:109 stop:453 length:345 start_codon:yes stop_codon:yes gene_type:complete